MTKRHTSQWERQATSPGGPLLTALNWAQLGDLVQHAAQEALVDHLYEQAHRFWLNGLEQAREKEQGS